MVLFIKLSEYLWENTTGEDIVGSERGKRERERDQLINSVREGV
jgi:hypothetical protein